MDSINPMKIREIRTFSKIAGKHFTVCGSTKIILWRCLSSVLKPTRLKGGYKILKRGIKGPEEFCCKFYLQS